MAVEFILIAQEDQDPYAIANHIEDCDEAIWDDEIDGDVLLPSYVVAEKGCAVCLFNYQVLERILEELGDVKYYEMALEAIDDHDVIESAKIPVSEIDIDRWQYSRTVAREISKLEIQRQQQQAQQSRQQANPNG